MQEFIEQLKDNTTDLALLNMGNKVYTFQKSTNKWLNDFDYLILNNQHLDDTLDANLDIVLNNSPKTLLSTLQSFKGIMVIMHQNISNDALTGFKKQIKSYMDLKIHIDPTQLREIITFCLLKIKERISINYIYNILYLQSDTRNCSLDLSEFRNLRKLQNKLGTNFNILDNSIELILKN